MPEAVSNSASNKEETQELLAPVSLMVLGIDGREPYEEASEDGQEQNNNNKVSGKLGQASDSQDDLQKGLIRSRRDLRFSEKVLKRGLERDTRGNSETRRGGHGSSGFKYTQDKQRNICTEKGAQVREGEI
jgi:hypothetical protein